MLRDYPQTVTATLLIPLLYKECIFVWRRIPFSSWMWRLLEEPNTRLEKNDKNSEIPRHSIHTELSRRWFIVIIIIIIIIIIVREYLFRDNDWNNVVRIKFLVRMNTSNCKNPNWQERTIQKTTLVLLRIKFKCFVLKYLDLFIITEPFYVTWLVFKCTCYIVYSLYSGCHLLHVELRHFFIQYNDSGNWLPFVKQMLRGVCI